MSGGYFKNSKQNTHRMYLKIHGKKLFFLLSFWISVSTFGQQIATELYEEWEQEEWAGYLKILNTYDENDLKVNVLQQQWNSDLQSFEDDSQMNLIYDNNENVSQTVTKVFNRNSGAWDNYYRMNYSYNQNDQLLETIQEFWGTNTWNESSKNIYEYDSDGNLIELRHQIINENTQVFEDLYRDLKEYDSQGNEMQNIRQFWNPQSNVWDNRNRDTYEYTDGLIFRQTENKWDNGSWINLRRRSYTYLNNDQIDYILFENWDPTTNSYFSTQKNTAIYNSDGYVYQYVYQVLESGNWVNLDRITYTYTTTVGIEDYLMDSDIRIYPNPTTNWVYFSEKSDVQLWNVSGQILDSGKSVNQLDLSNQTSGIYFLNFINESGKVIKRTKIIKK